MEISSNPMPVKTLTVNGLNMAYAEMGEGPPIVFQHGNPTSSYLWRNIMPHLADLGRCIAVDLVGMGGSDKLPDTQDMSYSLEKHAEFLDATWAQLGVSRDVILVIHDWGSYLGFDWAYRHPESVQGIAYMEAIVKPVASWDKWPKDARAIFQAMRGDAGEEIVLQKNVFVERILPSAVMRGLTGKEMEHYRAPFLNAGEDRRPTLDFPRQIPVGGEPAQIFETVKRYGDWLAQSDVPKLFINANPGSILAGESRAFCRNWSNQTEVSVAGTHFIQEDSPVEITRALRAFITRLRG